MKLVTVPGRIIVQDPSRTFTVEQAMQLVEQLLTLIPAVKVPELRVEPGNDGETVTVCPHCSLVTREGDEPVVEVDYGNVRRNNVGFEVRDDGPCLYPENRIERDFHTLGWLCRNCLKAVGIPSTVDVIYS